MTDICIIFEVHQPLRLNKDFHSDMLALRRDVVKEDLYNLYFDHELNQSVFDRVAKKCYSPANNILLEQIERNKRGKQFKVAFSISGVFVEHCERWNPDLLEIFRQLAESGCVEFLGQTYYHSLASLYGTNRLEFVEQLDKHRQLMKDLFNFETNVIDNTECLYNNAIAKTVEGMGYEAIVTEGIERILDWRSPNYVYKAKEAYLRVLLRNYQLSDDIGFRFSSTQWGEWPLTTEKYASWLAVTPGKAIIIFLDYETFGEHHWPESGIHDFLRSLPDKVNEVDHLHWCTPSEVVRRHEPVGEIDVNEFNTVSWADLERDPSAWIGNPMQTFAYNALKGLEPIVRDVGDEDLKRLWRYIQMGDHLYFMSTKAGGPGEVHNYFSPYGSPVEAFAVHSRILSDFEVRLLHELKKPRLVARRLLRSVPNEKGFTFSYEFARPTKHTVHSLGEFYATLEVIDGKSLRFHNERGDFERWIRQVIGDDLLSDALAKISTELDDRHLRKRILMALGGRIKELEMIASKP